MGKLSYHATTGSATGDKDVAKEKSMGYLCLLKNFTPPSFSVG